MIAKQRRHKLIHPSHFLWHLFVVNMTVMYSTRQIVCCPKITKFGIFQFFRWKRKVVSFELEIKLSSVANRPQCFPVDSEGLYIRKNNNPKALIYLMTSIAIWQRSRYIWSKIKGKEGNIHGFIKLSEIGQNWWESVRYNT